MREGLIGEGMVMVLVGSPSVVTFVGGGFCLVGRLAERWWCTAEGRREGRFLWTGDASCWKIRIWGQERRERIERQRQTQREKERQQEEASLVAELGLDNGSE